MVSLRSFSFLYLFFLASCSLGSETQVLVDPIRVQKERMLSEQEAYKQAEKVFADLFLKDALFNVQVTQNTVFALKDMKMGKRLPNGFIYGATALNYRFVNEPLEDLVQRLRKMGMSEDKGFVKRLGRYEDLQNTKGEKIPMLFFTHPDGSVIRIKTEGNPSNPYVSWPNLTISIRYPYNASIDDFSNETVKLDGKGHILPKTVDELVRPFPEGSRELEIFQSLWSRNAHLRLFYKVSSELLFDEEARPSITLWRLLNMFPEAGQKLDPTRLDSLVSFTQQAWLRPATKERWEMSEQYGHLREQGMSLIKDLGMLRPFYPQADQYDYAIVLGATIARVRTRLNFLVQQWQLGVRFNKLIFLTGQRLLDPVLESEAVLFDSANKEFPFPPERAKKTEMARLYETDMMKLVYMQSDLPAAMRELPVLFVDAKGSFNLDQKWQRPNTSDTVEAWLAYTPEAGSCLVISNNPFIGYQHAVLSSLLPDNFVIETVGPGEPGDAKFSLYLDTLARWLKNEI